MSRKAIFFDLDGVLVDSETFDQEVTAAFLKEIGSPIPPERFYIAIGSHPSMKLYSKIFADYDLGMTEEEFRARFREYRTEAFRNVRLADRMFPEVPAFLAYLKSKGHFVACASSSSMPYISTILNDGHIAHYFDLIVTCDDFVHSKPEPDIYLHCLEKSGAAREDCIVVEDSIFGIQAGKSAGLLVCARRDRKFGLDQSKADRLFDDLNELKDLM